MAREVKVAVVGDARQLQKELQKAEKAVAGFGKNAKESGNMLRDVFIGGTIALGAKQIIESASQLQAAVGGTAAIFGDAAGEVSNFAKSAAETVGLSEKAARDLTSKLGASLEGAGLSAQEAAKQSIFLTKTGADLAATLGGTTEEAVSALGGALRGEFDPLERFGIALKASDINAKAVSMGLAKSESDVSAYAKGQAALALITERSSFALGTFAKESNTAEGAAKIAGARLQDTSANLGKSFLPIYTKIAEVVGVIAEAFGKLPGPVQTALVGLGATALVGPKIFQGLSSALTAIKSLPGQLERAALKFVDTNSAMSNFGKTAEKTAGQTSSASRAVGVLGSVATVATVAATAYELMSNAVDNAKKKQDEINRSVEKTVSSKGYTALKDQLDATRDANKKLYDGLSLWKTLTRWDPWNVFADAGKMKALDESVQRMEIMGAAAIALSDKYNINLDTATVWLGKMAESGTVFGSVGDAVNAYSGEVVFNTGKTDEAATAQENFATSLKHAHDVLKATTDPIFAVMSAQDALNKANAEYEKIKNDGSKTDIEKEQALRNLYQASWDLTAAQTELGGAISNGEVTTNKLTAALDALKLNGIDPSTDAGQKLIEKMFGTGETARVVAQLMRERVLRAETDDTKLEETTKKLKDLGGLIGGGLKTSDGSIWIPLELNPALAKGRASGGPLAAGSPYMVGEQGPEMFIPASFGTLATTGQLSRMGGTNSTVNVTINMAPGANGDDVIDAIRRYERRNGPIFASA